ncbi:MAG TPA: hypothetical protein VFA56_00010 [Gaiellaceae bacterium]|nr:hypothetical protein [Gaiellaceae bacterium]
MLLACGVVTAAAVAHGRGRGSITVTLTVSSSSASTTLVVADDPEVRLAAARDDPTQIAGVADRAERRALAAELRDLDAFLATRPKLAPYRAQVWYVAHHARPPLTPRRLAALLWCSVWFPHACG